MPSAALSARSLSDASSLLVSFVGENPISLFWFDEDKLVELTFDRQPNKLEIALVELKLPPKHSTKPTGSILVNP